jgi:hypothetical protein
MTLLQMQMLFAELAGRLPGQARALGYDGVTLGEAFRSDEQAVVNALGVDGRARLVAYLEQRPEFHGLALAIANNGKNNGILLSVHRDRLGEDVNLFKNGQYLADGEAHRPLGEWWEKQHELCRWGGRFRDPNHYSLEHEGRK